MNKFTLMTYGSTISTNIHNMLSQLSEIDNNSATVTVRTTVSIEIVTPIVPRTTESNGSRSNATYNIHTYPNENAYSRSLKNSSQTSKLMCFHCSQSIAVIVATQWPSIKSGSSANWRFGKCYKSSRKPNE